MDAGARYTMVWFARLLPPPPFSIESELWHCTKCNVYMSLSYGVIVVVRQSFALSIYFRSTFVLNIGFLWDLFIPLNSSEVTHESDTKVTSSTERFTFLPLDGVSLFFSGIHFQQWLCAAGFLFKTSKPNVCVCVFPFELLMFAASHHVIFVNFSSLCIVLLSHRMGHAWWSNISKN